MTTHLSEHEARDRIETLLAYLRTLLSHAQEDIGTASTALPTGSSASIAALDGLSALAMAEEYLTQLDDLELRERASSAAIINDGPVGQSSLTRAQCRQA